MYILVFPIGIPYWYSLLEIMFATWPRHNCAPNRMLSEELLAWLPCLEVLRDVLAANRASPGLPS